MCVYRLESWAGGQQRVESPSCDDTFSIQVEGQGPAAAPEFQSAHPGICLVFFRSSFSSCWPDDWFEMMAGKSRDIDV